MPSHPGNIFAECADAAAVIVDPLLVTWVAVFSSVSEFSKNVPKIIYRDKKVNSNQFWIWILITCNCENHILGPSRSRVPFNDWNFNFICDVHTLAIEILCNNEVLKVLILRIDSAVWVAFGPEILDAGDEWRELQGESTILLVWKVEVLVNG